MSEANKQVVIKFIEAFSRGDAAAAAACLAPDAVTYAKGFGKLSGARPYQIIIATTGKLKELLPSGLQPNFVSVVAEGDQVAVEFEGNGILCNGDDYRNQYCMMFYLERGLIKVVNEYYCTILADEKILPLLTDIEDERERMERAISQTPIA